MALTTIERLVRCDRSDHDHRTLGEARVCARKAARVTDAGLPVHPSHRTWQDIKNVEGAYAPDDFPGESCADCGLTIEQGGAGEVEAEAASPCPGYEGDGQ